VNALLIVLLTAVGALGALTVITREPTHQAIVGGVFGLLLAALFYAVQAPDVALSELGVAGAAVPIMVLLAIAKIRAQDAQDDDNEDHEG
jgi:energy-converting hydrogenase B subunit D